MYITIFCKCSCSLRSLYQSYIDLESKTHFITPLLSSPAYSNLLKRCFAKGLVTSPQECQGFHQILKEKTLWIGTSKVSHTLPFSKKDWQGFECSVQKADLLSGTKHYYCIYSLKPVWNQYDNMCFNDLFQLSYLEIQVGLNCFIYMLELRTSWR